MDFFLFCLVNAALFIRPSELVPDLAPWPIYEMLILSTFAVAYPKIEKRLSVRSIVDQPITACVMGLLVAVVMSHLSHLYFWGARMSGFDFLKLLIYYLLLISVIDSVERLRKFLYCLAAFTVVLCGLAVLQHHGYVDVIEGATRGDTMLDSATGERIDIVRICSTGIFNDPNDLAMILVVGMAISAYGLTDPRFGTLAALWLAPIVLFGYASVLTHSRGGMMALLAGVLAFASAKYGLRRAVVVGVVVVPLLLAAFGGRQTDFSDGLDAGTGMERIQYWAMGLTLLRQNLLFGTGSGTFADYVGHVAHNSFVNAFADLGFFGGALFLGSFLIAVTGLWKMGRQPPASSQLRRMQPYTFAIVAGYAAAMFSLSREGVVPTYLILGLATVSLRLAELDGLPVVPRFNMYLVRRLAIASVGFVLATYVFVRVFARWG